METKPLIDLCDVKTGKRDANHGDQGGPYPFYTCADKAIWSPTYSFEGDLIILPGNGANVGLVLFHTGKIEAYQRTYILSDFKCDPRYLYHHMKAYWKIENQFNQYGSATNYIRMQNFKSYQVPVPPLAEQRRIATILDQADALRTKRRAALAKLDTLLQATFLDMFGDPVTNPRGWEVVELRSLIREKDKINYGVVQPGDQFDGGTPLVRVGDFLNGVIDKSNLKQISPEIDEKYKRSRLVGDEVLIACVGSIGNVALAEKSMQGFNIARAVARVPLIPQISREYIAEYLRTQYVQSYFHNETRTVSQPTLNIKQISETPVMLASPNLQTKFSVRTENVNCLNHKLMASQFKLDTLFHSLQQRAFKGEL